MTGVNVYLDPQGLAAEGITSNMPISINLTHEVSLRSALNLILQPLRLAYVIQNEVLHVTSEQTREADTYNIVYNVADLVIPIPNFIPSYNIGLPGAIREAHNALGYGMLGGAVNQAPLAVMAGSEGMGGATNASVLAQMGTAGMLPNTPRGPQPAGFGPGGLGGGAQADFDTLIELITATIAPTTWDEVGGPGSVAGFDTNLSLVVSQTQEVHEEIVDLLEQLRRLQDLQVTIEVRFITLNDNFFERIGIDFDFDIDDNSSGIPPDDDGPSVTIGLDPTGQPTADLDISFTQDSFGASVPAFGGFDAGSAANFGFAILSDIEAFFLIQALQGDTRTNVLQAPKVTLFNGQQAFVSDTSQRPFVTSVIPVVGDFAAAHQPVIVVLTEGTSLSVQAVVSNDRRFVRLTLVPFFSKIGDVQEFTFNGKRTSTTGTTAVDPSDGTQVVQNDAQDAIEGTTVQLPTFSFTTVTTTVSVPDGGTILLGGIKRLSEGRNERGVPMLNKLPYVNRLFKNVGIGRTTQSLMMMVTPRIIIQEEEEEKLGIADTP
jgi:general secretion pathway protein D